MTQAVANRESLRKVSEEMRGKIAGTVLGAAVGDALGGPVEFNTAEDIADNYGVVREMIGGGAYNWQPGEYTDDTDMMLCVAESIVARKGYDPADIARRFVHWYKSNPKDIGNTTRRALSRLSQGASIYESGDENPTNGSVMRCAPLSLVYFHNEGSLVRASMGLSAITHRNYEAETSCVFINVMIARLLTGADKKDAYCYAVKKIREINPGFARKYIESSYKPDPKKGLAVDTLLLATSSFLSSKSFEEAAVKAVNLGGDADTIGAVTGSLAGAYFGLSGVPPQWSSKLNPKPAKYFVQLADLLCDTEVR